MVDPLARFSPATQAWFASAFDRPTDAQAGAWAAIADGGNALVVAPTGSGKTLAAFLAAIDSLSSSGPVPDPRHRCRVLYVSPLKALAVDVERNLRAPLTGIGHASARLGLPAPDITIGVRSGDTPADERRRFGTKPPDILITTPESLFLILTSQARESLRGVQTVILDEVHSVAGTKRGAHLALSFERLDALLPTPAQRIGLSATVRPLEEVATFLGGARPVTIVQPAASKTISVQVVVPVEDMTQLGQPTGELGGPAAGGQPRASIWPSVEERIVDLIETHRSTIVFANSRRLAERLTARLNEVHHDRTSSEALPVDHSPAAVMAQAGTSKGAPAEIARAHHGSVSREQRLLTEEALKAGTLPAVVATSSLELGIDMGAVDLVVQVESPPSVASGLQRIGRAGHQVGAVSHGIVFPTHRGNLVQTAVVAERMVGGAIEALSYPRNPLDVLAQQIVSMVAMEDWSVADLTALVRRAAPYAALPDSALDATLDMLSGRYPSDDFAELRPRITWDRVTGMLSARPGAQRLAVTSGGTIPDRGLFGVFLVSGPGGKPNRVGELDEEMVYESRVGDVFTLGSSSWRIEQITHDRVVVSPAPGQPGKMPFWHGDSLGRPVELGRAMGAFLRELSGVTPKAARERVLSCGLDGWATDNLMAYVGEQREAVGVLPDDRTIVVERFRDELGDWRVCIHSVFGAPVNAPWALAIAARLRERYGIDVQAMHADDGIVLRLPETDEEPPSELAVLDPDELESVVTAEVGASALFASRFRECAARALLLPRRTPGKRTPLWQQRQRSAQLLGVASDYGSFPVVLETMRECLQDVFDVPGLVGLMRQVAARAVRLVEVETAAPSPFARSLLFGYVAAFLYEGDAPLAERRAAALSLDPALLADLLGRQELRELLDPDALAQVEAEVSLTAPDRRVDDLEGTADLLRRLGDLSTAEVLARGGTEVWLRELEAARRALPVRIAGEDRWIAVEDAGRVLDALGVPLPVGVPEAFLEPVRDPLGDLVSRFARTHGPFTTAQAAARFGLGTAVVGQALARLSAGGRVVQGELRPSGTELEWCDVDVLRRIRRRSLAVLRKEVEPVPITTLARFVPQWQGVGVARARGVDALVRAVEQLAGAAVPASALEQLVLPARVSDYQPAMLDELTAAGEVIWCGAGPLPGGDGWVALQLADTAPLLMAAPDPTAVTTPVHQAVLAALSGDAALFFRTIVERIAVGGEDTVREVDVVEALWDLAWSGHLTNDTLAPMRARVGAGTARRPSATRRASAGRAGRGLHARAAAVARTGPPSTVGRWSLLPTVETDPTVRTHAVAEVLLERHGVLTRGAVAGERVPGGFAAVYKVLTAMEDAGRCRRGYFVEGLGAAQFASAGAVDRLRALDKSVPAEPLWSAPTPAGMSGRARAETAVTVVLAATDPANPFGWSLPWPEREVTGLDGAVSAHRPGRKAGALVVVVDGELVLYVERGGKTLLTFTDKPECLQPAADALALAVREGHLGALAVERADGQHVLSSPLAEALSKAGFRASPRGLRLRA